jgi:hypothetical protein
VISEVERPCLWSSLAQSFVFVVQAQEFAGALGWSLSEDDERELHYLATKVKPVVGFPAESF